MRELWLVRKLDLAPWRANPYSAAAAGNCASLENHPKGPLTEEAAQESVCDGFARSHSSELQQRAREMYAAVSMRKHAGKKGCDAPAGRAAPKTILRRRAARRRGTRVATSRPSARRPPPSLASAAEGCPADGARAEAWHAAPRRRDTHTRVERRDAGTGGSPSPNAQASRTSGKSVRP